MKKLGLDVKAKAALWFTVCSFLQKGISFVVVPIFTRIMSTEQYGVFSLYISWYQILNIITSLYLFNGVYDNALSKFDDDRDRATSSFLGLTITITLAEFGITLLFFKYVLQLIGLPKEFLLLMFADAFLTPALAYWTARQRFEYKYISLVLVTLIRSLVTPIIAIILVNRTGGMAIGRVVAIVAMDLLFCGILLCRQFYKGKTYYDKKYWGYAVRLGAPMLPHYLSGIILTQGDRIVIDYYLGKTHVALYGLASSIGMLAQIFVMAINSAITPWMYDRMKKNRPEDLKGTLSGLMILIALLIWGMMLLSPEITLIFGSSKYVEAIGAIPPIAASIFFIFLYSILSFPQFYFEKTVFLSAASIIAAVMNIVLNILLVPRFGYIAAAYTTLLCYVLYSLGHWIVSNRILRTFHVQRYVDDRVMLITSACLIILTVVTEFLLEYSLIRYALILCLGIGILINYKRIIGLLANTKAIGD